MRSIHLRSLVLLWFATFGAARELALMVARDGEVTWAYTGFLTIGALAIITLRNSDSEDD